MRKLHCCECIQCTFIIIFPSSVFIFSFFTVIPPIYGVFFLLLLLQNCRTPRVVANLHLWWCLQSLQPLFISCTWIHPLAFPWDTPQPHTERALLLYIVLILKPSVPTRREQAAEMISVDSNDLPALWGRVRRSLWLLQGWEGAHRVEPRQERCSALPSGEQEHAVCSILLTQHWPAGWYSRKFTLSNLFIDCIPGPADV